MSIERSMNAMISEHLALIRQVEESLLPEIRLAVQWIETALNDGNKILFAGNGGSAADAQHLAAEFIGRFRKDRPPLSGIALTTDTSILTALGNDFGFEQIFSRQVEGLIRKGDILFVISTSGNSVNLLEAVQECQNRSCRTVGLLGGDGGELSRVVDLPIVVNSKHTARIQEVHITIGHIICEFLEDQFCVSRA